MCTAQALPVYGVEGRAAVPALPDVVGEHAMLGSGLGAAPAVLDPLAAVACIAQYRLAPGLVLIGQQFSVGPLGRRLDREAGRSGNQRCQCPDLAHLRKGAAAGGHPAAALSQPGGRKRP